MTQGEPSLRERQAQEVRDRLRAEFVRLLAARGPDGFTLSDVSSAAGVSDRTLYRYYPSREALIEAVLTEDALLVNTQMAERSPDQSDLGDIDLIASAFEIFEENADLVIATSFLRAAGLDRASGSARTERTREQIGDAVHPEALDQVVALFRLLAGSSAWARLREADLALGPKEAGLTVQWALQVILDAARKVDGPLRPDPDWTP